MGNLCKHTRLCWGDEILHSANAYGDMDSAQEGLNKAKKLKDGSITAVFKRKGKGKVTFSHHQYSKAQTRFMVINNHLPI
jgi:hypothetical protein